MRKVLAIAVLALMAGAACSGDDADSAATTQPERESTSAATTDPAAADEQPDEDVQVAGLDGTWDMTVGESAKRLMTLTCDIDSCTSEVVLPTGATGEGELARSGNDITSSAEDTCNNPLTSEWTLVGDELVGTSQSSIDEGGWCEITTSHVVAVRYDGSADEWLEEHGI